MTEKKLHNSTLRAACRGDVEAKQAILTQYLPLVKKIAAGMTGRYIQEGRDEEISIGLLALNEAIEKYDPDKGASFTGFASLVIRNRLRDYQRRQCRLELPASAVEDQLMPVDVNQAWLAFSDSQHSDNRRNEVLEYVEALAQYGLDLKQLAAATPRHRQARVRALQAAKLLASQPALARQVKKYKTLPLQELERQPPISRKTLERQRKYILALFILLTENYRYLSDYLPSEADIND